MTARKTALKKQPATADVEASDRTLHSIIWDLGRAYYAYVGLLERVLVEQKLDHILRPGMGLVLFALYEQDGCSIKELAERSQLACSTLTGLLQRMEKAELITRSRDAEDGRMVRVKLTAAARKLEKSCKQMAQRITQVSEKGVGLKNIAKCAAFLQAMTAAYRAEDERLSKAVRS